MIDIVREWVAKAEADYSSAELELSPPRGKSNYDLVCFLSQQCVEKYLKGFLQSQTIPFEKTHDLITLLDMALPFSPLWESWRTSFRQLKDYATEFRYPGEWADPTHASKAFKIAASFRGDAREALGLPSEY